MTDFPALPDPRIVLRAREMSCESVQRGTALETGIMNGYCDYGTIVSDFFNPAEELLMSEGVWDENIPDD